MTIFFRGREGLRMIEKHLFPTVQLTINDKFVKN